MKKFSASLLLVALLLISYLPLQCLAESFSQSYQLLDSPEGSTYYRLNVTVQQSLYEYYAEKSHRLSSSKDFAKFVTPYALKPIADNLQKIYSDDEDFVNGVLMVVHQIPYEVTAQAKYPVETIVDNRGDCDLLSFVAASIIKAAELDVVLLYYEKDAHMNVGVSLPHAPHDARSTVCYVTYNGVKYYIAECTGGNWKEGWRVGECPEDLKKTSVEVITLENYEQSAPGQVSASYKNLQQSTLSLEISPIYAIQGTTVTFSGQLSPALPNRTVTIYVKIGNSPWTAISKVSTDANGRFSYAWSADVAGVGFVRASWSGDEECAGADSPIQNITILSAFFILLLVTIVILLGLSVFMFFITRKPQQQIQEPQPPEMPP